MADLHRLIEEIRHLPPADRRRLLDEVEVSLSGEAAGEIGAVGSYSALLELAGTIHSLFEDVSSDKYKHLGEAYATRPPQE